MNRINSPVKLRDTYYKPGDEDLLIEALTKGDVLYSDLDRWRPLGVFTGFTHQTVDTAKESTSPESQETQYEDHDPNATTSFEEEPE